MKRSMVAKAVVALCGVGAFASAPGQQEMYPKKEGIQQPLVSNDLPKWLTLDMEVRGRTEEQTSLGYVDSKDRLYELTRVWGAATARATDWMTFYAQFVDVHALGLPLRDVASNMRDTFDLRQGYVDLHSRPNRLQTHLFVGRQELKFGDQRVVGISDWTNTSRTWDGFDLRVGDQNRVDLFSTSVVAIHPTSLDKHGAGLTFHGVEGTLTKVVPNTTINPFVLIHATPGVTSNQGIKGDKVAVTFGSYYNTKLPFGFDSSGTGDLQRGPYSNDSIHAGAGIFRFGYAAPLAWKPHLGVEYDYATGNAHRDLNRYGTYDQQYPSNHDAFGLVDLFGFQNIKQDRLNFSFDPTSNFLVLFQTSSLHLQTRNDTVYSGAGTSVFAVPTGGFRADGIGTEFDASAKYIWRKSYVTNIGVGHFFPGAVMSQAKHGVPLTLAYLQFTYRFKVDRK